MARDEKQPVGEPFLKRWSQRKIEAREAEAAPPSTVEEAPAPALPPLDELTPQSDFSVFMHPKVGADVRRAALKKLFTDPHFNVMDGLDTYIDDYSRSDPVPPAMLAGLRQAQNILAWARETPEETAARFNPPPSSDRLENHSTDVEMQALAEEPAPETQAASAADDPPDSALKS